MKHTPMPSHKLQRVRAILLAFILTGMALSACRPAKPGKMETLTLGSIPLEQNTLIYIAEQQGMFANNGLKIEMRDYDTDGETIQALQQGDVDLAVSAEFPFVQAVTQKQQISQLTTIDKFENITIVGRKDRGIKNIADLKGKRVGISMQTNSEFYLSRFLAINGIHSKEVVLVDLKPDQIVQSFSTGEVDAVITWQPYIYRIQQEVKDVVLWPAQNNQEVYIILACQDAWLADHTGAVTQLLKSLSQAEDFLVLHPKQARAIVQKRMGYDDAYFDKVWPQHQFDLTLDHSLIVAMTDEARWMIDNHLTGETRPPDFLDFIYLKGLVTARPDSVEINR